MEHNLGEVKEDNYAFLVPKRLSEDCIFHLETTVNLYVLNAITVVDPYIIHKKFKLSKQIIHICSGQIAAGVVLFHTILVADFWGSTGREEGIP